MDNFGIAEGALLDWSTLRRYTGVMLMTATTATGAIKSSGSSSRERYRPARSCPPGFAPKQPQSGRWTVRAET